MSARRKPLSLPALTAAQARALDAQAQQRLAMPSLLLMENAGRGAADAIDRCYGRRGATARAVLFLGSGNNGGDGAVVARHLARFGWRVRLYLVGRAAGRTPDLATQLRIVQRLRLPCTSIRGVAAARRAAATVARDEVVIDALLGTGARGPLREPMASLVSALNRRPRRGCVALDLPSGLDSDRGVAGPITVRADLTLTFAARKVGFARAAARAATGAVVVIDLGLPEAALARLPATRSKLRVRRRAAAR